MDDNQEGEGIRLPDHIIGNIMSRFRAKLILELRLESSVIVTLTTSQYFIQEHLLFAKGDIHQYGLILFRESKNDVGTPPECSSYGSEASEEAANMEIDKFSLNSFLHQNQDFSCLTTEKPFPDDPWVCVSNVNGIFCFHCNDNHLILWNPTTEEVKRTSSWNDLVGYPIRSYSASCGFGFGELLNEYFGMVLYYVNDFEYLTLIYKATTNSWRSVANFRGLNGPGEGRMITHNVDIVFVCNKFHWTVRIEGTIGSIENKYIVSFDPETDMYRRLENPRELINDTCYLGAIGTSLSWCGNVQNSRTWEIWMWEDDTWNFAFRLAFSDIIVFTLRPMCRLPDGQLVLECEQGVVCCDVNACNCRVVKFPEEIDHRLWLIQPQIYVETLMSPADLELVAGA